ncbi:MAG: DNRLRE domain-containing protein [Candidatus Eisenbacteria bacterium]|nr:DNRLRE domain-containing protein [Candidatus Eisenbacteria bacterium]
MAETRTLLRFELPDELTATTIQLAVVQLSATILVSDASGVVALQASPLTMDWSGDSVTWAGGWSTPGGDFDSSLHAIWMVNQGESAVVRFDVTRVVRAWLADERSNNGMIVRTALEGSGSVSPVDGDGGPAAASLTVYYSK